MLWINMLVTSNCTWSTSKSPSPPRKKKNSFLSPNLLELCCIPYPHLTFIPLWWSDTNHQPLNQLLFKKITQWLQVAKKDQKGNGYYSYPLPKVRLDATSTSTHNCKKCTREIANQQLLPCLRPLSDAKHTQLMMQLIKSPPLSLSW